MGRWEGGEEVGRWGGGRKWEGGKVERRWEGGEEVEVHSSCCAIHVHHNHNKTNYIQYRH